MPPGRSSGQKHILKNHIIPDISPIIVSFDDPGCQEGGLHGVLGWHFLSLRSPDQLGKMMHQALAFTYLDVWKWWLLHGYPPLHYPGEPGAFWA